MMQSATSDQLEKWVKKAVDTHQKLGLACRGAHRRGKLKHFKRMGKIT